ncbi:hypothetical protein [Paenibacillus chibensis]|uniref:hypothetical protein n=1 Tax=Paenibacillus chibensis TaxID=59846 RepID=UPI000FDB7B4D|nr:hypothetical protein [Paenibacillus chibensis]MEC0372102.1 hypothetical protein [Paenibacillus chibensis]
MNRFFLPGAAFFITMGTVLLLSPFDRPQNLISVSKPAIPVSYQKPGWELTSGNIVDALHSLPLTLPIRRVEWTEPSMSIDLTVSGPEIKRSILYQNIADILTFSFSSTINVNQVKLRLLAEDKWLGTTKHLLLALDAKREDWDAGLRSELMRLGESPLPDPIKLRLHVIETMLWKNHFVTGQNG